MIIGSIHWIVATGIAVALHLLGVLWLAIASPDRQLELESPGEGIVVTLGRDARTAVESMETLEPVEGASLASQPDAALDTLQAELADIAEPAPVEQESAMSVAETESAEAKSVAPETVESSPLTSAASAEPESARTVDVSESESAEPAASQSRRAVEVSASEEPVVAALSVETKEASQPRPDQGAARAPETAVIARRAPDVDQSESLPTVFTDNAPVPQPSRAPTAAREARLPAPVVRNPEATATERAAPDAPLNPVTPESGDAAEVDVATARQPAPEIEQVFEPDLSEPAQPETVDLEELQEGSGGTGVVASYAGVLKGWLQRHMHYPRAARLAGQEGKVVVRFVIDREGNVQSVVLESESGFPLLDREAKEMVERGDPFPAMPREMQGQRLEVRVPVSFHVRDETLTKEIPPIYLE